MSLQEYTSADAIECHDCIDEGGLCVQHHPDSLEEVPCVKCGSILPFRDCVLCEKHWDKAPLCLTCAVNHGRVCDGCGENYQECCEKVIPGKRHYHAPWFDEDDHEVCIACYQEWEDWKRGLA